MACVSVASPLSSALPLYLDEAGPRAGPDFVLQGTLTLDDGSP